MPSIPTGLRPKAQACRTNVGLPWVCFPMLVSEFQYPSEIFVCFVCFVISTSDFGLIAFHPIAKSPSAPRQALGDQDRAQKALLPRHRL